MSIAFSVSIGPSKILRRLTLSFWCLSLISGIIGIYFVVHPIFAVFSSGVALHIFLHMCLLKKLRASSSTYHLELSDAGEMVLRILDLEHHEKHRVTQSQIVYLTQSTLSWPSLMILSLRLESSHLLRIIIMPDSISKIGFRRLAVAVRCMTASAI
jgi:hypothetical protein